MYARHMLFLKLLTEPSEQFGLQGENILIFYVALFLCERVIGFQRWLLLVYHHIQIFKMQIL